ncbi:MAG TPA: tRNA (adenosine(37)-N6)-threonylcarbamoyltransferase complex dimerization subunit type 1 TsaB [Alphaproteobacteria bacterium]|nr:tRNA (adenosine(37)-N6)-threonylcarbamoyltransferase complex dimerization subunit type 1 TsaB [Alphaproteobacteria bacterium]
MFTLAFDTTTNFCSIALFKDNTAQSVFSSEMTFGQSEVLIPQIEKILKENKIGFNEIDLLCVCTGPGSFTGVRSSVSAARAFGLASKKLSLCGINAFDIYAHQLEPHQYSDRIAVLVETKREDFYVAYYDAHLNKVDSPKTAFYEDIIRDLKGRSVTFIGDGVERFLSKPSGLHIHDACFQSHPSVETLALVGLSKFNQKNMDFPKPLYLKAADVCVK